MPSPTAIEPSVAETRTGPTRKLLNAAKIAELPPEELDRLAGPERSRDVALLSDWVIRFSREALVPAEMIEQLCERLVGIGIPLDRYGSAVETLHAESDAIGRLWIRDQGVTERIYVSADNPDSEETYLRSPYYASMLSRSWLELWLPDTPDDAFGVVGELRADGYTHYLCVPIFLMNGTNAWLTFATRAPAGFSKADIATLARLVPSLSLLIEFRSTWTTLKTLLRTYVGHEPQQAILRGNTKRGQVSTITSAMLFADMRDSVGHTADLSAEAAVGVFNTLFDCLVPAIESRGGEVLKYIGDGLLAIFREPEDCTACDASERALLAAEAALQAIAERNAAHPNEAPMHVGIALHYGEAAYGNVGSGVRLDFTVIGRDVGLASRIANMNRPLNEPLLMSVAFVTRLRRNVVSLGAFPARGFREPVEVFRPDEGLVSP